MCNKISICLIIKIFICVGLCGYLCSPTIPILFDTFKVHFIVHYNTSLILAKSIFDGAHADKSIVYFISPTPKGKSIIDGNVYKQPDNIIFYATSNRRHLMSKNMIENGSWQGFFNSDASAVWRTICGT